MSLARSLTGHTGNTGHREGETSDSTRASTEQTSRGQATVSRSANGFQSSRKKRADRGLPAANDNQWRALYTRSSDGMLVYPQCYVAGCCRASFETVDALRKHVKTGNFDTRCSVYSRITATPLRYADVWHQVRKDSVLEQVDRPPVLPQSRTWIS